MCVCVCVCVCVSTIRYHFKKTITSTILANQALEKIERNHTVTFRQTPRMWIPWEGYSSSVLFSRSLNLLHKVRTKKSSCKCIDYYSLLTPIQLVNRTNYEELMTTKQCIPMKYITHFTNANTKYDKMTETHNHMLVIVWNNALSYKVYYPSCLKFGGIAFNPRLPKSTEPLPAD